MQRKISPRPTFKPHLESLEGRDLPSAAGIGLYMLSQNMQQGVQAMQSLASQAQSTFTQFGADLIAGKGNFTSATTNDWAKLGADVQAVRSLNTQIQAELQVFNQAVVGVASDGDQGDQTLAIFSYLQVNGGLGGSSGGLASAAQSALNQVNQIGSATNVPVPFGGTPFILSLTLDQRLDA